MAAEGLGKRSIANILNDEKIKPCRGDGEWAESSLHFLLKWPAANRIGISGHRSHHMDGFLGQKFPHPSEPLPPRVFKSLACNGSNEEILDEFPSVRDQIALVF